jgi:hypothetical protein
MKQSVFYSALAVAVAPVAAMAQANYMTKEPIAVPQGDNLNIAYTFTEVPDKGKFQLVITSDAATDIEYKTSASGSTYSEQLAANQKKSLNIDANTVAFTLKKSTAACSIALQLEPIDPDYIKNQLADYLVMVDQYMNDINAAGYTVSDENNAMLLLLHDIAVPGTKEYTVANFERFELYKDNSKILEAFAQAVAAVEADELAKSALTDEELEGLTSPAGLADAIKDAKQDYEDALKDFQDNPTQENLEKLQDAKNKLAAAQEYGQFGLTANKVQAAIDDYADLLDSYEATRGSDIDEETNEGGAALSTYQINAFRTSKARLKGIQDTLDEFLRRAAEAYAADPTNFVAPTDVDLDGKGTQYKTYADIETLLGTQAEPTKSQQGKIGVLNNIAYVKYCAQQYQARFEEVLENIAKATAAYNAQIVDVEKAFVAQQDKAPVYNPAINYFDNALEQVKTVLHEKVMEGEAGAEGIQLIEEALKEAKKNGLDISYDEITKWDNTPADEWNAALENLTKTPDGTLAGLIKYYTDATTGVEGARNKFDEQMGLITGTDTDAKLQYWIDKIGWNGLTDKVKTLYQEEYNTIVTEIQLLKDQLYKANENLGTDDAEPDYQKFQILNDPWLMNWDDENYDKKDNGNYSSYKNLKKRLGDLYNKVKNAKFEQEALWGLQANGQELSDRLRNASGVINNLTKDYTDPEYLAWSFYGYTGNPDTNTGFAKTITDYVALLQETAKVQYGEGDTDAAQILKNGAKTVDMARPSVNDFENKGGLYGKNSDFNSGEQWAVGYLQLNGTARTKALGLKLEPGQQASFRFKVENLDGNYWVKASIYNGDTKLAEKWVNRNGTYTVSFTATANYNDLRMGFQGNDARIDGNDNFDSKVYWGPLVVAGAEDVFKTDTDINDDSQTDDTWNDIEAMVKKLEADVSGDKSKDGVAKKAIDHYVEVRTAIETAQEQIQAVLDEVENHGVYTDKTSTKPHAGEYARLIKGWKQQVADKLAVVEAASKFDANDANQKFDDAHWAAIQALTKVDLTDIDTYYDATNDKVQEQVAKDKAEYDYAGLEENVQQLYEQIYGTDGSATTKKDGLVDDVLAAFKDAKETDLTGLIATYDPTTKSADKVFGNAANALAINQLWTNMEQRIKDASDDATTGAKGIWDAYTTAYPTLDKAFDDLTNAQKTLDETNDALLKVKDILDAIMATEGLNINDVLFDKVTNEKKLADFTKMIADNVKTYNEVFTLYQKVYDGLTDSYLERNEVTPAAIQKIKSDEAKYGAPRGRHTFTSLLESFYNNAAKDEFTNDPIAIYTEGTGADEKGINMPAIKALIDIYDPELGIDKLNPVDEDAVTDINERLTKLNEFDLTNVLLNEGLIQKAVLDAEKNKAAYDGLLKIKGDLSTRAENILKELDNLYEETDQGNALKDIITNYYKPIATQNADRIEKLYEDGKAYSEGPNSTRKANVDKYLHPNTWDAENGFSVENPDQTCYWVLKDSLTNLNKLYEQFVGNYDNFLAEKNENIFNDKVKSAYDDAYAAYDKAVAALHKFDGLKDEKLKEAWKTAFDELTLKLYPTPNKLNAAKTAAEGNVDAANAAGKTYDPANDLAAIAAIKNGNVDDPFSSFLNDMIAALDARGNELLPQYNAKIITAWDTMKDYKVNNGSLTPPTFADFYAIDGTPFVDKDTKYDYLYESKGKVKDATDLFNSITDPSGWDKYEEYGQFDALISGEILDVDQDDADQTVYTATDAHLKTKLNQAAHEDLLANIFLKKNNDVTPVAREYMGGLIEKTYTIDGQTITTTIGEQQKDGEGNPVDLNKAYTVHYLGFGATKAANGNYYSYKRMLGEEKYNELVAQFDALVAKSVGAAEKFNDQFYKAEELPAEIYTDEVQNKDYKTRDYVIYLLSLYDGTELNAIKDAFEDAYDEGIENVNYLDAQDAFPDLMADAQGILDLYVGDDYVDALKDLQKRYEDDLASPGDADGDDIYDITDDLNDLVKDAHDQEYSEMHAELVTLKDEYNQMMEQAGKLYDDYLAETDPDTKAGMEEAALAAKAERERLQQKFETVGDALNIDENIHNLDGLNANFRDANPDNDPEYSDYVDVEHNIALIKAEIAKERKELTDEEIAQKGAELAQAVENLLASEALQFSNEPAAGYLFEDFGLYENYLKADVDAVKKLMDDKKDKLNAIKESIEATDGNADETYNYVLLYEEKIKNQLAEFGNGGSEDLADVQDQLDSFKQKNTVITERAETQHARFLEIQAQVDAALQYIETAKEQVKSLGLTDVDGNDIEGDFSVPAFELEKIQAALTTYYLQGEGVVFDKNISFDGPTAGNPFKLIKYMVGEEVTDEWIAEKGLSTTSNIVTYKGNGEVEIYDNIGLIAVNNMISAEVQDWVNVLANQKYAEAEAAYDAAYADMEATMMRTADKEALRGVFYGTLSDEKDEGNNDTSYQKALYVLETLKKNCTINNIEKYRADVDAFIASLQTQFAEMIADNKAGDINGDANVNVLDLTDLVKYVTRPGEQKNLDEDGFAKRDLNNDGYIDVVDLGIMVDIITGDIAYLKLDGTFLSRTNRNANEHLVASVAGQGNTQRIAIRLQNTCEYTAFQMDVVLPEGMTLVGQSLGNRANGQELYANEWDGKVRLVGFTMSKAAFSGNDGDVLYLDVQTDDSYKGDYVKFNDVLFLTTDSKGVRFTMEGDAATGIMDRLADTFDAAKEKVYNLGGRLVNGMKKGVNIIRGQKVLKK